MDTFRPTSFAFLTASSLKCLLKIRYKSVLGQLGQCPCLAGGRSNLGIHAMFTPVFCPTSGTCPHYSEASFTRSLPIMQLQQEDHAGQTYGIILRSSARDQRGGLAYIIAGSVTTRRGKGHCGRGIAKEVGGRGEEGWEEGGERGCCFGVGWQGGGRGGGKG